MLPAATSSRIRFFGFSLPKFAINLVEFVESLLASNNKMLKKLFEKIISESATAHTFSSTSAKPKLSQIVPHTPYGIFYKILGLFSVTG